MHHINNKYQMRRDTMNSHYDHFNFRPYEYYLDPEKFNNSAIKMVLLLETETTDVTIPFTHIVQDIGDTKVILSRGYSGTSDVEKCMQTAKRITSSAKLCPSYIILGDCPIVKTYGGFNDILRKWHRDVLELSKTQIMFYKDGFIRFGRDPGEPFQMSKSAREMVHEAEMEMEDFNNAKSGCMKLINDALKSDNKLRFMKYSRMLNHLEEQFLTSDGSEYDEYHNERIVMKNVILYRAENELDKKLMDDELTGPRISALLSDNRLYGTNFNNLKYSDLKSLCTTNMHEVTHCITRYEWDGLTLLGDIEWIDTNINITDISNIKFVPRILGDKTGDSITDIKLITFDYITN